MSMQQRILVTGGTGFLGKHLIPHLIHDYAFSVFALARNPKALPRGIEEDILCMDLRDVNEDVVVSFLLKHRIGVVVHLAAMMEFYPTNVQDVFQVNSIATRKLASACAKAKCVERFVYCSTTETIGGIFPPRPSPSNEDAPCNPNYVYGESKVEAERIIRSLHQDIGLNYVILRPTGLFGSDDDFAIHELIEAVDFGLFFFIPSTGTAKLMFTHVDDAVRSVGLAITSPQALNNTFIICPDDALTYAEWLSMIAAGLGRVQPLFHLPLPVIKLAMQVVGPLFNIGKRRVFLFKPKTLERMIEDRWYTNQKAKKLLGFIPRHTLREDLQQTVREYKSNPANMRLPVSPTMLIIGLIGAMVCMYIINVINVIK